MALEELWIWKALGRLHHVCLGKRSVWSNGRFGRGWSGGPSFGQRRGLTPTLRMGRGRPRPRGRMRGSTEVRKTMLRQKDARSKRKR